MDKRPASVSPSTCSWIQLAALSLLYPQPSPRTTPLRAACYAIYTSMPAARFILQQLAGAVNRPTPGSTPSTFPVRAPTWYADQFLPPCAQPSPPILNAERGGARPPRKLRYLCPFLPCCLGCRSNPSNLRTYRLLPPSTNTHLQPSTKDGRVTAPRVRSPCKP